MSVNRKSAAPGVSRAVGTLCEVVSRHCLSSAVSPSSPMLLMWDSGQ